MRKNTIARLGMGALLSIVLSACSSSSGTSTDEADDANAIQNTPVQPQVSAGPTPAELEQQRLRDAALATRVFYFDFDQSELKPEAREALVYHAEQLLANSNIRVRLEGHADERGTREYNLALGERRAQAVQRYLEVQGVPSSRLEIISYGEERPAQSGTTEAAYALNRRVELVY